MESIHEASDPVDAVRKAEGIFIGECVLPAPPPPLYSVGSYGCCVCVCVCVVGGGNTFRLLKSLYDNKVVMEIRRRVLEVTDM